MKNEIFTGFQSEVTQPHSQRAVGTWALSKKVPLQDYLNKFPYGGSSAEERPLNRYGGCIVEKSKMVLA